MQYLIPPKNKTTKKTKPKQKQTYFEDASDSLSNISRFCYLALTTLLAVFQVLRTQLLMEEFMYKSKLSKAI